MSDLDPTEIAFLDAVDDTTRVGILRALVDAYDADPWDARLSYSRLRDVVGTRDKGNFNYHLRQLDDFIEHDDRGYRISPIGLQLLSAVVGLGFDPEYAWGPVDAPGRCHACGDDLHAEYEAGILRLTSSHP